MKKRLLLLIVASSALGVLAAVIGTIHSVAEADGDRVRSHGLFARRIAGSYLGIVPERSLQVLLNIGSDGGTIRVSDADAGAGGRAPFASRTPALGNWHRTGRHSIQLVELEFKFDADGAVDDEVLKPIVDLEFETTDRAIGTVRLAVFPPGLDPIEDDPVAVIDFGSVELRRLR